MCGIAGYIHFRKKRTQKEIGNILVNGLKRMEYRGYDSAGLCVCSENGKFEIIKKKGKVEELQKASEKLNNEMSFESSVAIAHTRWATHGVPCEKNSHPISSDPKDEFVVVHNGIITNHKELTEFLIKKDYKFFTDTDTEIASKLALYFYKMNSKDSFIQIIKQVVKVCDGAFAFVFISSYFPNEVIAVRKSSPLIVGVKFNSDVQLDSFSVQFEKGKKLVPGKNIDEKIENVLECRIESEKEFSQSVILETDPNTTIVSYTAVDDASVLTECQTQDLRMSPSALELKRDDKEGIEYIIASDTAAIIEHTKKVIFLEDADIVSIKNGDMKIHRFDDRETEKERKINILEIELENIMKGNFPHFMLKEIYEQKHSVIDTMRGRINKQQDNNLNELADVHKITLGGLKFYVENIKRSSRLIFVACGTSYHSALATQSLFEELIDLPVNIEIASDFLDRKCPIFRSDCVFFISQSGETADTLQALMYCKSRKALCVGITNTVGSSISRETECGVHVNCGPEIGVASTKAYSSQFIVLTMIALLLSDNNLKHQKRRSQIITELLEISTKIEETLKIDSLVEVFAKKIQQSTSMLILGRGYQYALCLEAALKIKELAYVHAEGILTGELKHGPIALIEPNTLILMIITDDYVLEKSENAVAELMARHGRPVIITNYGLEKKFQQLGCMTIGIPKTVDCLQGLLTVIPMQFLAYHLAVIKGFDVDCPRNLAKSVTVE